VVNKSNIQSIPRLQSHTLRDNINNTTVFNIIQYTNYEILFYYTYYKIIIVFLTTLFCCVLILGSHIVEINYFVSFYKRNANGREMKRNPVSLRVVNLQLKPVVVKASQSIKLTELNFIVNTN
jgi:hypothetical protein